MTFAQALREVLEARARGLHVVTSLRGSTMHGVLCDAFMLHGGFVAIDGELYEIVTMAPDVAREDAYAWTTKRARYAGSA